LTEEQIQTVLIPPVEFSLFNESPVGRWGVLGFPNNQGEYVSAGCYLATIDSDMLIENCTCTDYINRQLPCKHMFLVKKKIVNVGFRYDDVLENSLLGIARPRIDSFEENEFEEESDLDFIEENGATTEPCKSNPHSRYVRNHVVYSYYLV
jgi:uncharacterized Zn finger protein